MKFQFCYESISFAKNEWMEKPVIIFGAGDMGRAALDIFESNQIITYCFLDDDPETHGNEIDNISVMGSTDNEEILS
jgi:FlaA1/EpsC-like NDP-sugar epimerase